MAHQETHRAPSGAPGAGVDQSIAFSTLARGKGLIFLAAGLSFLMSVYLYFSGDALRGIFVGLWVPSILAAGSLLIAGDRHE